MCVACVSRGCVARSVGGEACEEENEGIRRTPHHFWVGLVVTMAFLFHGLTAEAVVNGQPVADTDRRLDAVAVLITDQPWAPCGGWVSGSCTLVAPHLVLMARHSVEDAQRRLPENGARTHKVRFRRGVDGRGNSRYGQGRDADCNGGDFQEIFIQQFFSNPGFGMDMVLGVLEHDPAGISPLRVALSHQFAAGDSVVLAGWGFDGPCLGVGQAWTLRSKTGVLPSLMYSSWCCFDYNQASFVGQNCFVTPPGVNWVIGNLHDSGAPLLVQDPADPSQLRVIAMVTNVTSAQKLSAWNEGGGLPLLVENSGQGPCRADLDGDSQVTVADLFLFVNGYLSGDARSDIDGVAGLSVNDLLTYMNYYFVGC
jgi:hypothetical protein